jgi:hypothetical protein
MKTPCRHQYDLETVGGVYLTGAYVCRLCSHRTNMTDAEFRRHMTYPYLYQEGPEEKDLAEALHVQPNEEDRREQPDFS